jgi:tetratricopeptide (TPR) repeat protein
MPQGFFAMKRVTIFFLIAFFFALPVTAKDNWVKVTSKHFTLVGNANERDIRTVGTKLEQFRSVFAQLFPTVRVDSPVPITVIVFKNKSAYQPFMPLWNGKIKEVGGYFLPGQEINYISLAAEFGGIKPYGVIFRVPNPYGIIFHEYVHSLTNDSTANLPVWLDEGIAEFYSTFEVSDKDNKVQLGAPISHHLRHLRDKKFLPLSQLFTVNRQSPEYNERDKTSVFYAQSWALVHYLMLGNNGQRRPQINQFINAMAAGMPMQQAFTTAFQTDFTSLEKELRDYVERDTYAALNFTPKEKILFDGAMTTAPMGEAEANFHLGDLLAHQRRPEAEKYLQTAIELEPTSALPHASLALIHIHNGHFEAAQKYLEKAVADDKEGKNYLVYYYYAMALMREGSDSNGGSILRTRIDPLQAQQVRRHLQKAIQMKPNFSPACSLLAYVNLTTGEPLDETAVMLNRVVQEVPGNQELAYQLAQVYLRQQKMEEAKHLLAPMARNSTNVSLQVRAQGMLNLMQQHADQKAEFQAALAAYNKQDQSAGETDISLAKRPTMRRRSDRSSEEPTTIPQPIQPLLREPADGQKEVKGLLVKMECSEKGITLYVTVETQKLIFQTNKPLSVEFINHVTDSSEAIACQEFNPSRYVRIIYRIHEDANSKYKGEAITVEFIKPEK